MRDPHLVVFEAQRKNIQRQVAEVSEFRGVPPWQVFVLVLDLRSEFGRDIALRLHDRIHIDRAIREAEARGEAPGLTVPVFDESGLEIIRMFVPALEEQVTHRPPLTVALMIVDEHDDPLIGIGRLRDARLAVS